LLDEVLAADGLDQETRRLAAALRNEFDARISLVAELARERQLAERRRSEDATGKERRIEALAVENQRLRRELSEAQSKLNAIEDIERTLSEQSAEPVEPAP
jgi:ATP phosphoribosyltransferase regulatory subunit HisZ